MKHSLRTTLVSVILVATYGIALPIQAQQSDAQAVNPRAIGTAIEAKEALRDLWVEHIFWIRNVVIETLAHNTVATKVAEAEVLANAKRVASSIEPFYGKAASDKFYPLIVGHYDAIKQYLAATVARSSVKQDAAWKEISNNADALAEFLGGATNLPVDTVRGLILAHGAHHVAQIKQLHDHHYGAEAQTWIAMRQHMYVIADGLSGAIVIQFPAKFKP